VAKSVISSEHGEYVEKKYFPKKLLDQEKILSNFVDIEQDFFKKKFLFF